MRRVLVLGGGFGGLAAAQRLGKATRSDPSVEVTLVNRTNFLTYTPFLADVAGGTLAVTHAVPPLRWLAASVRHEVAEVEAIDVGGRHVTLKLPDGTAVQRDYDYLLMALGGTTSYRRVPGAARFGLPLSTIADAYMLRNRVLEMLELASISEEPDLRRELLTFVFCGGGFSGIEGAAAIEDLVHEALPYYRGIHPGEPRFILVSHGRRLLAEIDERLGDYVVKCFEKRKVDVRLGVGVTGLTEHTATLSTGEVIPTRTVLWAPGIDVNPLLRAVDLPKDGHGAIRVGRDLQVEGRQGIFAVGDCAAVPAPDGSTYAPTAQNAIRQGSLAATNILTLLEDGVPNATFDFRPMGSLASLGHRRAVAEIRGVKVSGILAWFMWRGVYLGKIPHFSRKLQVGLDWVGDLFNPVEITYMPIGTLATSRPEFVREAVATRFDLASEDRPGL